MLTKNFIDELFRLCLLSERVLTVCTKYLEYHYLPNETYKDFWKEVKTHFSLYNRPPSVGVLAQKRPNDNGYLNLLEKVKTTDVRDDKDIIIDELEKFLKDSKVKSIAVRMAEYYNDQEFDKAHDYLLQSSEELANFTIKDQYYDRIFGDYLTIQEERESAENAGREVVPTGIPQFDYDTHGGIEKGTAFLAVGRSNTGKSPLLKTIGLTAARSGFNVIHFQGEGTRKQVRDNYHAAFTGRLLEDIKLGNDISPEQQKAIQDALEAQLQKGSDIVVVPFEQFNQPSISQCRAMIKEIAKTFPSGKVDLVIFDYLDLFNPNDVEKFKNSADGEKRRKKATALAIVNLATELNVAIATATQCNNVPRDKWNDPGHVITRENITSDKETIEPFAYCITLNQTEDERENKIMRIYEDKLRDFPLRGTFKIYQANERGRFIDTKRTLERFWDHQTKTRVA